MKTRLKNIFSDIITGEWGDDDPMGKGINIIRTANFKNDGRINFTNVVTRLIQKNKKDNSGKIVKEREGKNEKEIDYKKIEEKKLLNEDIIIEKSGGGINTPVGRVVFFNNPNGGIYLSNNFTHTLRVDKNVALPKFIFYYFKHLYNQGNVLKYQNQTTGIFNLRLEKYLQEEIKLPELSKQFALSTQLDTIQKLIDKREESIKILNKLIESIYYNMFGDPVVNNYNHKKIKLSSSNFKITSGITPSRKNESFFNGEIPWVKSSDINKEIIYCTEENISEYAIKNTTAKIYPKGSVLLAMYGQGSTRGKAAILEVESSANQACAIINSTNYSNIFLFFTLKCSYDYLRSISKGGNRDNLSLTEIKKLTIINPPLNEQKEFESKYNYITNLKESYKSSLNVLETLFQSVLQNAFNPNTEIDEKPIFKELIKNFKVEDLKRNKNRLQYLIELFEENKFENVDEYIEAKDKLFDLILTNEIEQRIIDDKIILEVK